MKTFRRKVAPVGLLWCCTLLVFNFQPSTGSTPYCLKPPGGRLPTTTE
ncbi:MAG: hypothetical protein LBG58_11675 [Planctomycetaceae bacterium]|nr:hypothetical protein [Planctomycetaceae bacterium]